MTEAEWRSCNDVEKLLNHLWALFPAIEWKDRKPTLLFCACGNSVQHLLPREFGELLAAVERGADGRAEWAEIQAALERAERAVSPLGNAYNGLIFSFGYNDLSLFGYETARVISQASGEEFDTVLSRIQSQHSDLVRDIFSNPSRGAHRSGSWIRETSVQKLAREIYDAGTFDRVQELGHLLEAAGCRHDEILNHCQESRPHVRGCWVIDLLLGKS